MKSLASQKPSLGARDFGLRTSDLRLRDVHKQRAVKQWNENPCGTGVVGQLEFGTREYFEAIERNRYDEYAPWMKQAIGFDRRRGKRLLEVGCGTGTDLLQFARGGAIVTGIDLTPRSIEIARRRFEVYGLSGDFMVPKSSAYPLVKAYTRSEARRLFRDFSHAKISVNQLTRKKLRPFGRYVPARVFQWLARAFGWNLLIRATK